MRRVLVDHARRRHRLKRGAGGEQVSLEEAEESLFLSESEADELVALDDALERLGRVSARGVEVIQHRFFGGLSVEETAQLLGVSTKTVQREWVPRAVAKEIARDLGFMPDRSTAPACPTASASGAGS
jgi:RNA polymerase sigma factor (TIGR02999 family)